MADPENVHYPFMFNLREAVTGQGFLAGVTIAGRSLMLKEDEQWWMYGVRPGAVAENGATPKETFLSYMETLRMVLRDLAADSKTYSDFRKEVERFFHQEDAVEEERWEAARLKLRSGQAEVDKLDWKLPKESPERRPAQITVLRLDSIRGKRLRPTDNIDYSPQMAA